MFELTDGQHLMQQNCILLNSWKHRRRKWARRPFGPPAQILRSRPNRFQGRPELLRDRPIDCNDHSDPGIDRNRV